MNLDRITDIVKPPKLRHCHFQEELKQVPRIDNPGINSASVPWYNYIYGEKIVKIPINKYAINGIIADWSIGLILNA